jgi:hypothetical protein
MIPASYYPRHSQDSGFRPSASTPDIAMKRESSSPLSRSAPRGMLCPAVTNETHNYLNLSEAHREELIDVRRLLTKKAQS